MNMSSIDGVGSAAGKVKSPLIFFAFFIGILAVIIPFIDPFRGGPDEQPFGFYLSIILVILIIIVLIIVTCFLKKDPSLLTETSEERTKKRELESLRIDVTDLRTILEASGAEMVDWFNAITIMISGDNPKREARKKSNTIIIGTKEFPESQIANEIISQLIKNKVSGVRVDRKLGLGGSMSNMVALRKGIIDIYVDYTGTGMSYLGEKGTEKPEEDRNILNEYFMPQKIKWLKPLGYSNEYVVVMLTKKCKELFGEKMTSYDLNNLKQKSENLIIGGSNEFMHRKDGILVLTNDVYGYGIKFSKQKILGNNEKIDKFTMLAKGDIDVLACQFADFQLNDEEEDEKVYTILKDPNGKYSRHFPLPVMRDDGIPKQKEIEKALELSKEINTEKHIRNLMKDYNPHQREEQIRKFLVENELI